MSSTPTVSVVIATYNWSSALRYSIRSVLWQSFRDFELLVIGDGCTDDSENVALSFGDPRVRWHNLPDNSGNQFAANNAGIAMAKGRYIAYLGHDDIWLPTHLADLVAVLEETAADLAYSWIEMVGPDPETRRYVGGITASGEFEEGMGLAPSSVMHTRRLSEEIGPWKDYRTIVPPPDLEFFTRAFHRGKRIVPLKKLTAVKFNASWRPGAYVKKPVHQQEAWVKRILERPDFITEELHLIIESIERRHPNEIPRWAALPEGSQPGRSVENARLLRGLQPMPLGSVALPPQFPPLRQRISLDHDDADPYLLQGWSVREPGFRWTDGSLAVLIFSLEKITDLELRVQCAPLLVGGKLDSQKVTLSSNGQQVAEWILSDANMAVNTARIAKCHLQSANVLTLSLPGAARPINLVEGNVDARLLGLRVEWIEFSRI